MKQSEGKPNTSISVSKPIAFTVVALFGTPKYYKALNRYAFKLTEKHCLPLLPIPYSKMVSHEEHIDREAVRISLADVVCFAAFTPEELLGFHDLIEFAKASDKRIIFLKKPDNKES